mgnify:CR=1 FL=1
MVNSIAVRKREVTRAKRCVVGAARMGILFLTALLLTLRAQADVPREVGAFQLLLSGEDGGRSVGPLATHLDITIVGPTANVRLIQHFKNPTDEWINATYAMPLPSHAAVHGWIMTNHGRRIVGVVAEREEAKARFEAAVEEGRTAGMLSAPHAGVHTVELANIAPQSEVVLEVELSMLAELGLGAVISPFGRVILV